MMSVGRSTAAMTFAIVNVLPEPVTPSSVWCLLFARRDSTSVAMACGWSPVGAYSEASLNKPMWQQASKRACRRDATSRLQALESEHLEQAVPEVRPEAAHAGAFAAMRRLLQDKQPLPRKQVVEQRVHVAVVSPERLRAHGQVVEVGRETNRGALVRTARRTRESLPFNEPLRPDAPATGHDKPARPGELKIAELQRHPRLPAEEHPPPVDLHRLVRG